MTQRKTSSRRAAPSRRRTAKGSDAQKGTFSYRLTASLIPTSPMTKLEFDARMSTDTENEFFGQVTLNSSPPGARILINSKPALNEKGSLVPP